MKQMNEMEEEMESLCKEMQDRERFKNSKEWGNFEFIVQKRNNRFRGKPDRGEFLA